MQLPPPDDEVTRQEAARQLARRGESDAFAALALIISGVLVWGGVGFALSAWLDNRLFVMVGLLVGMAGGLSLVWLRYGRPQ